MLAYFPSDISSTAKDTASSKFQQFVEKCLSKCKDVNGVSYGWGLENDFPVKGGEEGQLGSLLIAFIGCDSIEAHERFRETEGFKENVGLITGMEGLLKMVAFHINCRSLGRKIE
jgi:hypothetical protein